jgi:hypothetical protein
MEAVDMTMPKIEALTHPAWCDPAECRARNEFGQHRGTPIRVERALLGDATFAVQLVCNGYEPLGEASVSIDLVITRSDCASVEGYNLDERTALELRAALDELSRAFPGQT